MQAHLERLALHGPVRYRVTDLRVFRNLNLILIN